MKIALTFTLLPALLASMEARVQSRPDDGGYHRYALYGHTEEPEFAKLEDYPTKSWPNDYAEDYDDDGWEVARRNDETTERPRKAEERRPKGKSYRVSFSADPPARDDAYDAWTSAYDAGLGRQRRTAVEKEDEDGEVRFEDVLAPLRVDILIDIKKGRAKKRCSGDDCAADPRNSALKTYRVKRRGPERRGRLPLDRDLFKCPLMTALLAPRKEDYWTEESPKRSPFDKNVYAQVSRAAGTGGLVECRVVKTSHELGAPRTKGYSPPRTALPKDFLINYLLQRFTNLQ